MMIVSYLADKAVYYALTHARRVVWGSVSVSLLMVLLAVLPNFVANTGLPAITVDTDPENMLSHHEPVRVFHDQAKKTFALNDMIVVGISNDNHPQGVFNKQSLTRIYQLTEFAKTLRWPIAGKAGQSEGVIAVDIIAPSTVDNIEQGGLGSVNFSWLMPEPPASDQDALLVRQRAANIPFLNGTLISEDGKAIAIYLPITSKTLSYKISAALKDYASQWAEGSDEGGDQIFVTGLPVAEDTFGVEMFIQMAISAPLAMLAIFLLLLLFFKKLILVTSPMIVAMLSAVVTMALLVISGNTIHIMSSMIPIFVMPIAVLDAIHILSEFFDRYPRYKDKRETLKAVMHTLFMPMLFTTLTTMAGFLSLALTPIPPVQVFGVFVAVGVFIAWLLTMLFIPAYVMLIPEHKLEGYGHGDHEAGEDSNWLGRGLQLMGRVSSHYSKTVIVLTLLLAAIAGYGITLIQVNDNPTKWFAESHEIRIADKVLNEHFGGTYMANLSLQVKAENEFDSQRFIQQLHQLKESTDIQGFNAKVFVTFEDYLQAETLKSQEGLLDRLSAYVESNLQAASNDDYYSWDELSLMLSAERQRQEIFKQPEVLVWMAKLQTALLANPQVGKINSLTDIVKTVHRELLLGEPQAYRIPDTANAVGQTLITYQNSHRPQDLWHFVTPDFRHSNLWLQLTSGDNREMEAVIASLDNFLAMNPAPENIEVQWFGLTYINVAWQEKMVFGMLESFLGSFIVVLVMMTLLFRSPVLGLLSMLPLTLTVALIYGIIGLIGKDYDMPVAILSALSLGLAVDYAIHFIARAREAVAEQGSWSQALPHIFGEPARAISRNAIVLSAGFLPLLAAPLVPYQTVGIFIAAIILLAGIATLLIMPAIMSLLQRHLFKSKP